VSERSNQSFDLSGVEALASALRAQVLARMRAVLEHDIKNVLHGMLSGTELLSKSLSANSPRVTPAECLVLLQQQLSRAQTTFHRILDDVTPASEDPADIDLAQLAGDCAHALRHQLQMFNAQLTVPAGLKVHAARDRLKDIVMFLLLDSIDRAPARSRIEISAQRVPDDASVTLMVDHTQDPSVRLPELLPTLAALVQSFGGRLNATTNDGQRSVRLFLPLSNSAATTNDALDLLIVDANPDAADSLAMLAQLEGFGAQSRYDIASATAALHANAPRAVIVDLDGSVDGRSLLRTIRSSSGRQPRAIGLSHSHTETIPGFDAYLRKPLDLAALRRALER
jgi:CheY-like chemotaxis protein